ncbi:hypothetical protein RJ640_002421 [Escallonia rubra]|uniref:Late embryogenesis abundant protein n=1 Tax=Escallonia rubra TaxID=112253 RepID=A0AA88RNB3_9ASTE|nr:hypothetical protein RJ640_002421 [Escallonia rubra]
MQAIKEKFNDMSAMRKAKAEAKEEEKGEKDLAKARVEVAHEVRLAREAEAAMDLHVNKAADKVAQQEAKHSPDNTDQLYASRTDDRHRTSDQSNLYGSNAGGGGDPTNITTTAPPSNKYM